MAKPIVLSGAQPSGQLTIGNYMGALRQWVNMQDDFDCLYCIVDLHAITTRQEPAALRKACLDAAALYLAVGIDPAKSTVFIQSHVPQHAELGWILNCYTQMGELSRMTQFKDKSARFENNVNVGLFGYPVLMAADILLYQANQVPVGNDQKQHLELTRDIAAKFNNDFGAPDFFPQPDPIIQGPATRVMSLRDGLAKMSKSDPSDLSRINLTDDADTIAAKIKKAKSDMDVLPDTLEGLDGRPEAKNLVAIYAALSDTTREAVLAEFGGQGFGAFKPKLAELAVTSMAPVTAEMRRLMADPAEIDRALAVGAERAREVAQPVVDEVKKIVGFWRG